MSDRLFDLLPAVYRLRDHAQGHPLRALLSVIDREVQRVEDDIAGLYDNWFIETCDEWVVPYIGDLLGVRPLVPLRDSAFSQRGYVANTLGYRRRKGTAAVLEQLARDLTGWPARAVEFFERLVTTQHVNHARPNAPATADLRGASRLQYVGTPFESVMHTADVRHVDNARGRYNIPHIGLFVWRLQSHLIADATARRIDDTRYTFDPLGGNAALFTVPATESDVTDLAQPHHVPLPISRRTLHDELTRYYGTTDNTNSLRLSVADAVQPAAVIDVCDLSDTGGGHWAHAARTGRIAIDPRLGRIAFGDAPSGDVTASFAYGFGGDLGGGPYDRRASLVSPLRAAVAWQMGVMRNPPASQTQIVATLTEAVDAWNQQPAGTSGVIVLMDSRTYTEDLDTSATRITIPSGSQLIITSAQWPEEETGNALHPMARLTGRLTPSSVRAHLHGTIDVVGTAAASSPTPGRLVLNGLLFEGALDVAAGNLGELNLAHCTLAPGLTSLGCESNPNLIVSLTRSICGDLSLGTHARRLHLTDTIVDGDIEAEALQVESSTIFGRTRGQTLDAGNSIFVGEVTIERRQVGCVRFCYLPFDSRTPRRHQCRPPSTAEASITPVFIATRYGEPGYAMLAPSCPVAIGQGADDESEMGAWHFLQAPLRLRNLRVALDEYLRFGLEAGIVVASQQP